MQVATSTAFKRKWSVCAPIDHPDSIASALISCDEERFPNIFRLMKIGCTLPITSCTCERSFSTLRRLRNWLRSSMTCRRLSSLSLMNIHYSHPVNYIRHSCGDISRDAPKKNRTYYPMYLWSRDSSCTI